MLVVTKFTLMYWVFWTLLMLSIFGMLKAMDTKSAKRGALLSIGSLIVFLISFYEVIHAI